MTGSLHESVLLLFVPEAEPVVRAWRDRYDPSSREGVPAHVTLLYPFLPAESIGTPDLARLRSFFGGKPPLSLTFSEFGRFPGVLFLKPDDDPRLRDLLGSLLASYPELPPYGGQFPDPQPHHTVAQAIEESVMVEIEADVSRALPFASSVSDAALMVDAGGRWVVRERFTFGESGAQKVLAPR